MNDTVPNANPNQRTGFAKWISLIIILLAQLGTMGDNAGLVVAANALVENLDASVADIAFANAMYPLIAGACMIAGGMLGLITGWIRLLQIGAILLMASEFIAATTGSIEIFIYVARALAGFGASFLVPAVLGLIAGIYHGRDRALAFGAVAAILGFANAAAPLFFGFIIGSFSYKVAFYGLSTYFGIVLCLSFFIEKVEKPKTKVKFDFVGTVLVASGLLAFIIGLLKITEWGLITPYTNFAILGISPAPLLALVGIILLVIFLRWEKHYEEKTGFCLMPQSFVKTPQVRDGLYLTGYIFLLFGAYALIAVPYMQLVAGFTAFDTAKVIFLFSTGMVVTSMGTPVLLSNISSRKICILGMLLSIVAALLGAWGTTLEGINALFYASTFIIGLSSGFIASQSSLIVTAAVNQQDATQSSGVQATSRNVGQTIGIAILATTMMFSISGNIKSASLDHPELSTEAKEYIDSLPSIEFLGDKKFVELIQDHVESEEDIAILVATNQQSRRDSTRLAWYVLAVMGLIGSFAMTRNVPDYSLSKKES